MTVLLDTDVLIDCLRGVQSARDWLQQHSSESFQVPGVVAMELLIGCRNQAEIQHVQSFLNTFDIAWTDASEFSKAFELLAQYRLAAALSIPDCIIAAMALARSLPLYTFNLRHFQVVNELKVQQPYSRA